MASAAQAFRLDPPPASDQWLSAPARPLLYVGRHVQLVTGVPARGGLNEHCSISLQALDGLVGILEMRPGHVAGLGRRPSISR